MRTDNCIISFLTITRGSLISIIEKDKLDIKKEHVIQFQRSENIVYYFTTSFWGFRNFIRLLIYTISCFRLCRETFTIKNHTITTFIDDVNVTKSS